MYDFDFHPIADIDFAEAIIWYEKQQIGLGARFSQAVNDTLQRIQKQPELFHIVKSNFREAFIPVFPYSIVYRFNKIKKSILIVAIYHAKRNPKKKFRL
jgi:plasmid stabilization system protein ParE